MEYKIIKVKTAATTTMPEDRERLKRGDMLGCSVVLEERARSIQCFKNVKGLLCQQSSKKQHFADAVR
jgi:hypothetical protein